MAAAEAPPLDGRHIAEQVQSLPSLPVAVLQLLTLLRDGEVDIEQLARRLSLDQALSAKVLRLANSPFYGLSGRIASIRDGINILGVAQVRSLVLVAVMTVQFERLHGRYLQMQPFWRHGIGCAITSRALARAVGLDEGAAFTAGLLHDIGRLVLDSLYPQEMGVIHASARHADVPVHQIEVRQFGVSHTEVGGWLARHWRFEPAVCRAISQHHEPQGDDALSLVDVVHVADAITHALDLAGDPDDQVPNIRTASWDKLRLSDAALQPMFQAIEGEFAAVQAVLGAQGETT